MRAQAERLGFGSSEKLRTWMSSDAAANVAGNVLQRDVVELLDENGQMHADAARGRVVDDEQIEEVGLGLVSLGEHAKVRRPGQWIGGLNGEVGGAAEVDQIDGASDRQHDRVCGEGGWRCSGGNVGGGHTEEFREGVDLGDGVVGVGGGEGTVEEVFENDRRSYADWATGGIVDEGEIEVAGVRGVWSCGDAEELRPAPRSFGLDGERGEAVRVVKGDEAVGDERHDAGGDGRAGQWECDGLGERAVGDYGAIADGQTGGASWSAAILRWVWREEDGWLRNRAERDSGEREALVGENVVAENDADVGEGLQLCRLSR